MKILTKSDIPCDAKIENDMILNVCIARSRGFILELSVQFVSKRQEIFLGYANTANIGFMILALADLLGVNKDGHCMDILDSFKGTPCRIASNALPGDRIAEQTWIGHFMKDEFALAHSIILEGLKNEALT